MKLLHSLLLFFLIFTTSVVLAQTAPESPSPSEQLQTSKRESLLAIIRSQVSIQSSLNKLIAKEELSKSEEAQKKSLQEQLDELKRNFREISSGIDLSEIEAKEGSANFDWVAEIQQLLEPLLNEIKRSTSAPREIDRYRTTISDLTLRISESNEAIQNIEQLQKAAENNTLSTELIEELSYWKDELQQLETQLSITEQKLEQRLNERKSFFETVGSIPELFFKSRGRNLFIALLATILFWIGLNWLRNLLQRKGYFAPKKRSFQTRLFYVIYLFSKGIGTVFVFLFALSILGDWVLLTLGGLLLLGVIWTSKQVLPQFWTQATLLLNMGTVREGERVEYMGLPWLVKSIYFYSDFVNPALDGGKIRVPLRDLEDLRSRKHDSHEPWFPSHNGDWVILDDGTYGKVVWQGIDGVRILQLGGATKTYTTENYLDQNPKNLSMGFRVSFSFGFDYADQAHSTTGIPDTLKGYIEGQLHELGLGEKCNLKVEFQEAAASSLNLAILADFDGELGNKYQSLGRLLKKLCVDACNHHKWNIPFNQLTVHMENPNS